MAGAGDPPSFDPMILSLGVALGIGLLIGAERERRKGEGASRAAAGVRTFALAALIGAVSLMAGGVAGLCVALAVIGLLAAAGYRGRRGDDPGLTTEVALLLTACLGALSVAHPAIAAGAGVVVAVLLATRTRLHRLVRVGFSAEEARDALVLAAVALVVLPLLPDRAMGPFRALNPHGIGLVVVLVLGIGAAGHVAVRIVGARLGLPIAGLMSGFVSSIATIAAFGNRARGTPQILDAAASGAILSTVATVLQLSAVLAATSPATAWAMAPSLLAAALAAGAYAAVGAAFLARRPAEAVALPAPARAFSLPAALGFAGLVAAMLLASAALRAWFGEAGLIAGAALAGLADTHAAAISIAALVARGDLSPADAVAPILAAFLANTLSKAAFAFGAGGPAFARRVAPGLALVAGAACLPVLARWP